MVRKLSKRERKELETAQIISNQRCCICGTLSENVCGECLERAELACFCDKHAGLHAKERTTHYALWQIYGGAD